MVDPGLWYGVGTRVRIEKQKTKTKTLRSKNKGSANLKGAVWEVGEGHRYCQM